MCIILLTISTRGLPAQPASLGVDVPVSLKLNRTPTVTGNRGKGFHAQVTMSATYFLNAQAAGHISPKEIVAYFDNMAIDTGTGHKCSVSAMRRALHRGRMLGFDFRIQSNADAGARPRRPRRSRYEIEQGMRQRQIASLRRAMKALTDVAITSSLDSAVHCDADG